MMGTGIETIYRQGSVTMHSIDTRRQGSCTAASFTFVILAVFLFLWGGSAAAVTGQRNFSTPEDAVAALVEAVRMNDTRQLLAIFGAAGRDLVMSGDETLDREARDRFLRAYEEKNRLENVSDRKAVLHVGEDDWPMAIPIVRTDGTWRFDTKQGRQEILARRIGRNELAAIQVCLAYVDAQREYAQRQSNSVLEYAQRFASDPGKDNGLCWDAGEKENLASPMGPLVARACRTGITPGCRGETAPYHGYFYRILTAQGKDAPGGAYDYIVNGRMIGGFGLVAYPARYRSTGVMTFIVNHDGIVYQKDLGKNTVKIAETMTIFNPDPTWKKVE
ncbi:MAG: DUF2950 domain-containing protein [Syntrophorhabdaceae bacterium]|nr:DUF2950 domain-containing protein [Syntrophorhabdaceae bacterium]